MDHRLSSEMKPEGVKSVSLSFILSLPAVRNKTRQQQRAPRDTACLSTYDNSTYISAATSQLNTRRRHAQRTLTRVARPHALFQEQSAAVGRACAEAGDAEAEGYQDRLLPRSRVRPRTAC